MVTIAACMIVRDGGEGVIRCLDSVKGTATSLVVIDTGSTDGTPERIREWAEHNGLPLDLSSSEWVNFKVNRTELMQRARGQADWLLLLDDDMVLHVDKPLRFAADSNLGRIGDGIDYKLPLLVRGSKPWFYEGVAHSYLACEERFDEATEPGLWVEDHSSPSPEKIEQDAVALATAVAADPLDARSTFYLAQSYWDLDRKQEALHYYRTRGQMQGWAEETYFARLRQGVLACELSSFSEGARILLSAWESRPNRAEALRALGDIAHAVADKIPYPDDLLFVHPGAYRQPEITPDKISAVIVTRGNVDLDPVTESLPYDEVIVWDNSKREDWKIYGRYKAAEQAKHDVIFSVDDDVIFSAHKQLMHAYEPGKIVTNMDEAWVQGAGYGPAGVCLVGAGALWDRRLAFDAFSRYLAEHPLDEDFMLEADFIFGSMTPFKRVDLGYEVRPFADDADRLYQQPGQTERKWAAIHRAKALVAS